MTSCPHSHPSSVQFDHNAPNHREHAESVWASMRAAAALLHSSEHGGFYILTRYNDVAAAARMHAVFSSAQGVVIPDPCLLRLPPLEMDPPLQSEYRRLLAPFLTRESVARYKGRIQEIATDLINGFLGRTSIDFVEVFAAPFPSRVALNFLGFPSEDALSLECLINTSVGGQTTDKARAAAKALSAYIERFLGVWRSAAPDPNSIVSAIAHGTVFGKPLSSPDQNAVVRLLLFGGFTTTTFALSSALRWLAEHPADRQRLRETPALLSTAVDEFVRFASPGTYVGRTVAAATHFGGADLCAGDRILLSYGAANRDASAFTCPDGIQLDREPNRHLAFGHGVHACMGLHLARLELQIAIEAILSRLIDFEINPKEAIHWMSGDTQGMTTLPLLIHKFA
jgi:cytochrome P450